VLLPLDDLHLADLRVDLAAPEAAVDDADAAFLGHRDRHVRPRHRVHVRRHDWPLEREPFGNPRGQVDGGRIAPLEDGVLRREEEVVEGAPADPAQQLPTSWLNVRSRREAGGDRPGEATELNQARKDGWLARAAEVSLRLRRVGQAPLRWRQPCNAASMKSSSLGDARGGNDVKTVRCGLIAAISVVLAGLVMAAPLRPMWRK
jgi:hypothetical protein